MLSIDATSDISVTTGIVLPTPCSPTGAVGEHGVGSTMPVVTEMSDVASIESTTHGDVSVEHAHADQGESGF